MSLTSQTQPASNEAIHARATTSRLLIAVWLAWGALLVALAGYPPVRRTQEARVLETAREMLDSGMHGWIIPHLNGRVRVEKPPLAYWLSAASYKLFGVSELAGRLPFALVLWLIVGLTFIIARRMICPRAAFFAAVCLAGSYMFLRYGRLAETDALATLFVTASIYALWRSAGGGQTQISNRKSELPPKFQLLLFHLAAISAGIGFNAKQGAIIYPIIFVLLFAIAESNWRWLKRLILSGATITLLLFALPWYAAAIATVGSSTFWHEAKDIATGRDHPGTFFQYFPDMLLGLAPWTALLLAALLPSKNRHESESTFESSLPSQEIGDGPQKAIAATAPIKLAYFSARKRFTESDPRARFLILWIVAIFLPLCFAGNKQPHYLVPLLPPLMIFLGWRINDALGARNDAPNGDPRSTLIIAAFKLTLIFSFFAAEAFILVPRFTLGRIRVGDIVAALAMSALIVLILWIYRTRGVVHALIAYALACAIALPTIFALWAPTLNRSNTRDIAAALRAKYGRGPYCFYGDTAYFPLCFAMQRVMPLYKSPADLAPAASGDPSIVVLEQAEESSKPFRPPAPPPGFISDGTIGERDERMMIYRRSDAPAR